MQVLRPKLLRERTLTGVAVDVPAPPAVPSGLLDLGYDYRVFDGLSNVLYYGAKKPYGATGWSFDAAVPIAGARIEKIQAVEVEPSAGVYDRYDTRFRLPYVNMPARPTFGSTIEDSDGRLWTILYVGEPRFRSAWTCGCRILDVRSELADSLTWLAATVTNVRGSKITTHATAQSGIVGRVQVLSPAEILYQARLGFDVNFKIWLMDEIDTGFGDLLQDGAGVQYEVKSNVSRHTIDNLACYLCKRRP